MKYWLLNLLITSEYEGGWSTTYHYLIFVPIVYRQCSRYITSNKSCPQGRKFPLKQVMLIPSVPTKFINFPLFQQHFQIALFWFNLRFLLINLRFLLPLI